MPRKCVVPNCGASRGSPLHVFPNPAKDPTRFKQWVTAIGGILLTLDDSDIYRTRAICNIHFEEMFYNRNNRLSNIAVPTLHMPDPVVTIDVDPDEKLEENRVSDPVATIDVDLDEKLEENEDCPISPETQATEPQSDCSVTQEHDYSANSLEAETVFIPEYVCPDQIVAYEEIIDADCQEVINDVTLGLYGEDTWMEEDHQLDVPLDHQLDVPSDHQSVAVKSPESVKSQDNDNASVCKVICDGRWKKDNHINRTIPPPTASITKDISKGIINRSIPHAGITKDISKERLQKRTLRKLTNTEFRLHMRLLRDIYKMNRLLRLSKKRTISLKSAKEITRDPAFLTILETSAGRYKLKRMMSLKDHERVDSEKTKHPFSLQQKLLALTIFKLTPPSYNFLKQILHLPSIDVLKNLIGRRDEVPGINPKTFSQLKNLIRTIRIRERLCVLLYEEISLKLDVKLDVDIVNENATFPEYVRDRRCDDADYVQVFIIRGLIKNYVQPVSYSFTKRPLTGVELAQRIKRVVTELQKAGSIVVSMVIDVNAVKKHALDILLHETRCFYIMKGKEPKKHVICINNKEIVLLYDPPTLLKCVRNHFLTKHLIFTNYEDADKLADWGHIELFFNERAGYNGFSCTPKLTEKHVVADKIPLGKTKYASQVFSRTVGVYMGFMAENGMLPEECTSTADVLLFFNKLFDSLNGTLQKKTTHIENLFLRPVTPVSRHHTVWQEAKKRLATMRFVDPNTGEEEIVDAVKYWLWTLDSIEVLLKTLVEKYQITSIWMRQLNQDPIESFFASILSDRSDNDNPLNDRFDDSTNLVVHRVSKVYKGRRK